jgi:hypothetical protein
MSEVDNFRVYPDLLDDDEREPKVTVFETGEVDDVLADGIRVLTEEDYTEGEVN